MRSILPGQRERGAIAVEAGLLIAFVLAPLLLGMVELALFLRDHSAATTMSRAGARAASQLPRTAGFDQVAADSIERSAATISRDAVDFICVFSAEAYTDGKTGEVKPPCNELDATGLPKDCKGNCVAYRWFPPVGADPGRFGPGAGSWSPTDVSACQGDPKADSVGVLVQATHPWFFGFLGTDTPIRANTVMRFEPLYPDHTIPGVESGCKQI